MELERKCSRCLQKDVCEMKLHLGCGGDYIPGYINSDLYAEKVDERFDALNIPYPDNSFEEVKAFHIIEHFDFYKGNDALKEWFRVLMPGGRLHIETPDFLESCRMFVENDDMIRTQMYGHFFSTPWIPGQQHLFLFTQHQLTTQLTWAGFTNIKRILPTSRYVTIDKMPEHIFLCMEAFKP